jgi:hypothetical protein
MSRISSGRGRQLSERGKPLSDRSRSNGSDNSAKRIEPHQNKISNNLNSKFVLNTRTINRDPDYRKHREALQEGLQFGQREQDPNQNVDDKIQKLQQLLAMAKKG